MNCGIQCGSLTLATESDFIKAIGLAQSLQKTNASLPKAIVCSKLVADRVRPYFDLCIDERDDIRGFMHKLFLDEYSPFERTLFLDADVLVFKNLKETFHDWSGAPYTARGDYRTEGKSEFGLDRKSVLAKIEREKLVCIEWSEGMPIFKNHTAMMSLICAREIGFNYSSSRRTQDLPMKM